MLASMCCDVEDADSGKVGNIKLTFQVFVDLVVEYSDVHTVCVHVLLYVRLLPYVHVAYMYDCYASGTTLAGPIECGILIGQ